MTAISNRSPPVDIEYDCRGKRKRKHFANASAGRAFYVLKIRQDKNPRICKSKGTTMAKKLTKEQLEKRQLKQAITRINENLRRNCLTLVQVLL